MPGAGSGSGLKQFPAQRRARFVINSLSLYSMSPDAGIRRVSRGHKGRGKTASGIVLGS